jgi:hypothetical protein
MGRIRSAIAATVVGAAIAAPGASAQTTTDTTTTTTTTDPPEPPVQPQPPVTLPPPSLAPKQKPKPQPKPKPSTKAPKTGGTSPSGNENEKGAADTQGASAPPAPLTPTACGPVAIPAYLGPIYQAAAQAYDLGPAGPSILAAINEIESGFGQNMGPSSAGAVGWMQFMPSTWAEYGVDADHDGTKDPNNPNDAIFAAARYLRAAGMPADPEGAVFAYNHADWYVAEVMARAACFSGIGNGALGGLSLIPKRQELVCSPADGSRESIPVDYMQAFQDAAGR